MKGALALRQQALALEHLLGGGAYVCRSWDDPCAGVFQSGYLELGRAAFSGDLLSGRIERLC